MTTVTNIQLKDYVSLNHLFKEINNPILADDEIYVYTHHVSMYDRPEFDKISDIARGKYFQHNKYILNLVPYLCLYSEWAGNFKILIGAFVRKCDVEKFKFEYKNRTDLWLDYVHVYIAEDGITEDINSTFKYYMKTAKAWIKNNHIPVIKNLDIVRYKFKTRKDATKLASRAKEEIFLREFQLHLSEYFKEVPIPVSSEESQFSTF